MNIFESIHVQGFRRLHDVQLKLRPLNVLIGANGSGKTSLLDVFTLLSASAAGQLKETIREFGGVDSNLSANDRISGGKASAFAIGINKSVSNIGDFKYRLTIKAGGITYQIPQESLIMTVGVMEPLILLESAQGRVSYFDSNEKDYLQPQWRFDDLESVLSQVPKMFQEPEYFRYALASLTHYHALDVRWNAPIRLPQQMREAKLPGQNGEDLAACLYWMREADPDRYETIEDTLRVGFPSFERLNFPPVAAGLLAMTWKEKGIKHPFFMHQLSEGTLRFLWLVTLLYSPGLTEVTLLDEPEVSLHPELLSVLADCMREASTRTQLIVATHADRLVRFLRPEEVVTLDMEEGMTTATRADDLDLDEWLKEYTLDQVWQHGRMGGRT